MGRNGMGKTTTVHAIMGLLPARRGSVEFEGSGSITCPPTASPGSASAWCRKAGRSSPT